MLHVRHQTVIEYMDMDVTNRQRRQALTEGELTRAPTRPKVVTNKLCFYFLRNMIRCTVCNTDYNDGELERHLIMYHITTNENIAKYIAHLEERINILEAAQPRPKMEP